MPEQPFKPEDVIGKIQDEGGDELLVVKVLDEARIYAQDSSGWYSRGFYVDDVAELFRQLAAKDAEIDAKAKVIMDLSRDKATTNCRIQDMEGWALAKDAQLHAVNQTVDQLMERIREKNDEIARLNAENPVRRDATGAPY